MYQAGAASRGSCLLLKLFGRQRKYAPTISPVRNDVIRTYKNTAQSLQLGSQSSSELSE